MPLRGSSESTHRDIKSVTKWVQEKFKFGEDVRHGLVKMDTLGRLGAELTLGLDGPGFDTCNNALGSYSLLTKNTLRLLIKTCLTQECF